MSKRVFGLASKQQMMLRFPSVMDVLKSYQIGHFKFDQINYKNAKKHKRAKQQQMMLPFPSINVGQQYLPECPNEMPPNQLKKCQILQIAVKQTKNQFG